MSSEAVTTPPWPHSRGRIDGVEAARFHENHLKLKVPEDAGSAPNASVSTKKSWYWKSAVTREAPTAATHTKAAVDS